MVWYGIPFRPSGWWIGCRSFSTKSDGTPQGYGRSPHMWKGAMPNRYPPVLWFFLRTAWARGPISRITVLSFLFMYFLGNWIHGSICSEDFLRKSCLWQICLFLLGILWLEGFRRIWAAIWVHSGTPARASGGDGSSQSLKTCPLKKS